MRKKRSARVAQRWLISGCPQRFHRAVSSPSAPRLQSSTPPPSVNEMCSDPNAPDPGRFCCMRGWVITVMIFGILEILFGFGQVPTLASPPCFICPNNMVNYSATAGYRCDRFGTWSKSSNFESHNVPTEAACMQDGGYLWVPYTCAESHYFWAFTGGRQAVSAGLETCSAPQTAESHCCMTGTPAPSIQAAAGGGGTLIQMMFLLLGGALKFIASVPLSCCGGKPTRGKMMLSMIVGGLALLLDIIGLLLGIVSMLAMYVATLPCPRPLAAPIPRGSVLQRFSLSLTRVLNLVYSMSDETRDFLSAAGQGLLMIITVVGLGWTALTIFLLVMMLAMIQMAKKAGIGAPDATMNVTGDKAGPGI